MTASPRAPVSPPSTAAAQASKSRAWLVFLLIFLPLAAGIIATGAFHYHDHEIRHRAGAAHQLAAIAELKVNECVRWREAHTVEPGIFFRNPSFTVRVRRFFEDPADESARRDLLDWLDKLPARRDYDQVRLLDAQGVTRLSVPDGRGPAPSAVLRAASESLQSGRVALLDFYRDEHDQRVYLAALVPLIDDGDADRPVGVLAVRIDPEAYLYPLIRRWPTPSATAETLLVRRDGNDVLFLNDLRFRPDAALNLRIPLQNDLLPAAKAVLGQEGIVEGRDYRGVPVAADVRAVPDSPWFLVARMDAAEVYAPMRARLRDALTLMAALLFGAGASAGVVWRQQRARIYRTQLEATKALEQSERRFRLMFESHDAVMLLIEPDSGRIIDANRAAARLYGHPPAELRRMCIEDINCSTPEQVAAERKRAANLHQNLFVFRHRLSNGDIRTVEVHSTPVELQSRRVLFSVIHDITERKRAEDRVEHLNAVLRAIRNVNQLIVKAQDREALIKDACDTLTEALGYPHAWIALTDRNGAVITSAHSATDEAADKALSSALARGEWPHCARRAQETAGIALTSDPATECPDCPLTGLHADCGGLGVRLESEGVVYGVMAVAIPQCYLDEREEQDLFLELAADIAFALRKIEISRRHRELETQIKKSENKYRTLCSNIPGMVYRANAQWSTDIVSNSEAVCGYSVDQLGAGKPTWQELIHPHDRERVLAEGSELPKAPASIVQEYRILAKDGSTRWVSDRKTSFFTDEGSFAGMDGVVYDVTEQKDLQTQLQQSQKLEAIGTLAGGVAHEINNPIMGIMNYAQLILDRLGPDSPVSGFATEIGRETGRVATIVKNLLSFARQDKERHSPARLCDVVEATLALVRAVMRHDQVTLDVNVPEDLPMIDCRSQQIQQVLMNLLTNARDALNEKYPGADENKKIFISAVEMEVSMVSRHWSVVSGQRSVVSGQRSLVASAPTGQCCPMTNDATQPPMTNDATQPPMTNDATQPPMTNDATQPPMTNDAAQPPMTNDAAQSPMPNDAPKSHLTNDADRRIRAVRLTIEDHGTGIPEAVRERIFDPFYTTKPRDKGTGLGLSISHGILRDHGGKLSVESEVGEWTRFYVDFPVKGG